jgi:cobalt-zinc-cadmium efflux system outer membrane protein
VPGAGVSEPLGAQAEDGGQLTLERALALAAGRSYLLSSAQLELDATNGTVRQADTRPNPELSTTVEDTRSATRTTTAVINIPFELGNKRAARVAVAERGRDIARAELSSARADLRASVVAAFFRVLVSQERLALSRSAADIARRGADVAGRRVAAGKISPVDETRSRVEQANAELEVSEAQTELTVSRLSLASLWASDSPNFTAVEGTVDALPVRPSGQGLLLQLDDSPALIARRLEADRFNAVVEAERSNRTPDLTVSVGAKRDNELGLTQAVVGLSIPLPVFNRNEGGIYEASKRALKAQDDYRGARVRMAADLQQSSSQLTGARLVVETLRTTVLPAAQSAYDASTKGFEAGKFGLLDVLDSQRALLQARARYLSALANAYQAASDIDRLLGR